MMKMMFALNKSDFKNQREVTCYSCHRGARTPIVIPSVDLEAKKIPENTELEIQTLSNNLLAAREIIDRYVRALGGAAAIERIASRVEKGTSNLNGKAASVEISTKAPGKRIVLQHSAEGDTITGFDENTGWVSTPGRPFRELHGAEIDAARMDANLQFPLEIQKLFPELRVEYPEQINQQEVDVLFGIREEQPAVKFYFDRQTGLLVRLVRFTDSPLGLNPTQIDYADYREVDGVQVPFRIVVSQPGSNWKVQLQEVRQNIPIDDSLFGKPQSDHSPAKTAPRK
jgi:hypothetical protein